MVIELLNIGPVKQMKLDLSKRLITFMGLNGTGKTYISYVVYSLLRGFQTHINLLKDAEKLDENTLKGTLDIDSVFGFVKEQIDVVNQQLFQIFNVSSEDGQFKDASVRLLSTKESISEDIIKAEQNFIVTDLYNVPQN